MFLLSLSQTDDRTTEDFEIIITPTRLLKSDLPLSPALENIALMPEQTTGPASHLHRRRITLPDGRYLIFYTFDEEFQSPAPDSNTARPQPDSEPRATEES